MDRRRTVFLDRDGVLNEKAAEGDYVKHWSEFRFLPGVVDALIELKKLGFLLVVVTNQRCVAKGIVSEEELHGIHTSAWRTSSPPGERSWMQSTIARTTSSTVVYAENRSRA